VKKRALFRERVSIFSGIKFKKLNDNSELKGGQFRVLAE
tara:strand:- start:329 stop:445 length:117 start_codon:yes stop_codon:yes gene_type:complete